MSIKFNKNIKYLFILPIVFFMIQNASYSITPVNANTDNVNVNVEDSDEKQDETSIIKKFSLKDKLKRSPQSQVENFIKKYNRYSETNKIEKLKELYSDSYVNNDGFDKNTIFKLMKEAADLYKNVKYTTTVDEIKINGSNAVVSVHETAVGETSEKTDKFDGSGLIESEMNYVNYLRKENGEWKLLATDVRNEKVALKYGEAKNLEVIVNAPECVAGGSEYEVSVKTNFDLKNDDFIHENDDEAIEYISPDGLFMVGSITNDLIKYPQSASNDVLRAFKAEELARILKSNKEGYNEYATVSIGITRAHIKPPSVVINMTGMAIVMSRVNTIQIKNNELIKKESGNGKS